MGVIIISGHRYNCLMYRLQLDEQISTLAEISSSNAGGNS